ncbi:major facilitator superfamily domain-containing protein 6 isoform X1 [Monomorium pharaonis]|uniref:major facilitator superfamily domain-containing protein 6 isoform X1 n=1 Tax=Monomorium pharaonis TaxID=307658 RepID=UPI00063F5605|nr:major facilitator superfamily domain-containing protein 6 isoform X1 [Monomorium pharaonis]XP_012528549.1 major facilitator superfamily domain-containing protein 6 isoform X1 [Monomorium pharaonis]XP_012528551.1 major facilitator superfamily domain-containing protein 6 isoform X1 [Monomorium pharaonis]XP_012528552.1 major facilitator superfamily domain-containing protein 6 isoform X1 [Monomorium pharaonis]XP_012528553.1 major facilitator superfamily domain-containing protein 6 isoform X1 [Mo
MLQNVNKELAPIKSHYFLYNAATGPMVQFLPTIGKQLGFSATVIGTIYTVLPISGLIAKPLFGSLADRFRLHKTFFLIFEAILAIAFFSIYFIPEIDRSARVTLVCNNDLPSLEICPQTEFSKKVLSAVILENVHTDIICQLSCKGVSHGFLELSGKNISANSTFEFGAKFDVYQDLLTKNCVDVRLHTFLDGTAHVPVCGGQLRSWCTATCHNSSAFNHLLHEAKDSQSDMRHSTYQFYLFLWAAIISWIGMAVVVSIADAICFDLLGHERRKDYGKQKMWGSIGFGIFGISSGYLIDLSSKGQYEKDYTCIFYIMLVAMIADIVVSATLKKKDPECSADEPSLFRELLSVVKEGRVLVFAWWCIGAGMCTGVIWNFLFWYSEDLAANSHLTWIKTLQGLMTGVQCFLGELPFNFVSGSVLKKLGHVNVMSLVLLIYAIRFMAYSIISNAWLFLILELLHGPSFGLCWPTMVSYGDKVTPSGTKATMQGFIGAVFEGIGVASGSFICGWLIDSYGGVTALRTFSVGALLWLSIFWLMELLLRKLKAYPLYRGHNHLANYANPDDAILMTISQELQTY